MHGAQLIVYLKDKIIYNIQFIPQNKQICALVSLAAKFFVTRVKINLMNLIKYIENRIKHQYIHLICFSYTLFRLFYIIT